MVEASGLTDSTPNDPLALSWGGAEIERLVLPHLAKAPWQKISEVRYPRITEPAFLTINREIDSKCTDKEYHGD
jgi:hypothetical protein